ncbi:MAG: anaerobic sulfatase maturase [Desulfatirhabdiaceae bacterium]
MADSPVFHLDVNTQIHTSAAYHVLTKPSGSACNLDCRYCFYLSRKNLYPDSTFRMTEELLETYIRQLIEAHQAPEILFIWQGGEPTLMGLNFFRRAIELQNKYHKPGTRIRNAMQTNGTMLNEEWCRFFYRHNFLIGVSLDGPRPFHDAFRLDKTGSPTFDRVTRGITLLRNHQVEFNILAAVHAASAGHGLQIYRFFRDRIQARMIQFIPIVERDAGAGLQDGGKVTKRSISGSQYGEFLISIFNEWVRRDVGRIFVQIFDVALGVWFGHPSSLCIFSRTCGDAPALEHNGDLFSCDHFVEPRHKLGNIMDRPLSELLASNRQIKFGQDKLNTLPNICRKCGVRFICNGGCPKDRFLYTDDREPGLNFLCEGYQAFFSHIDRPMQIMAALLGQRCSPAGIMTMIRGK